MKDNIVIVNCLFYRSWRATQKATLLSHLYQPDGSYYAR